MAVLSLCLGTYPLNIFYFILNVPYIVYYEYITNVIKFLCTKFLLKMDKVLKCISILGAESNLIFNAPGKKTSCTFCLKNWT